MIFPFIAIAFFSAAILLLIEFAGSKREEKKDFVLDQIKFDGKKPVYKILLGELGECELGEFCLTVSEEIFKSAPEKRNLIYSFRRGKASGWKWAKKFERWTD